MSPQYDPRPSQSVQGTSAVNSVYFSFPQVLFWALLSIGIHISIHTIETVEWNEPEQSALVKDIESHRDKSYQFDHFYKWMVKEIKKDFARGEVVIARTMNWRKGGKGKSAPFSKSIAKRLAQDVSAKLRANGLNATANGTNVTVELD